MKKFLAIYLGSAAAMEKSGWSTMDEAKRKKLEASGMKAWGDWMAAHQKVNRIFRAGLGEGGNLIQH